MLKFKIRNQQISRVDSFRPVEKSVNYLYAEFTFCTDDWDGAEKKAVCKNLSSGQTYDATITDNKCLIPWESINEKGSFELSVWGTVGDVTVPTGVITVELGRTLPRGIESNPPSPTEIDLIKQEISNIKEQLEQGGGGGYVVQDTEPEDTSVLWVDTTDDSDDGFQEAVDAALAQAKESGAFDGADGITPHVGENGNWFIGETDTGVKAEGKEGAKGAKGDPFTYEDFTEEQLAALTGPQGPQGIPGDDYVLTDADKTEIAEQASKLVEVPESGGIAVTGATVGQTVKITAVDENGVPTAWKSVDFPSGGGEEVWEDICNIVFEEEVLVAKILTPDSNVLYKKIEMSEQGFNNNFIFSCSNESVSGKHGDAYDGTSGWNLTSIRCAMFGYGRFSVYPVGDKLFETVCIGGGISAQQTDISPEVAPCAWYIDGVNHESASAYTKNYEAGGINQISIFSADNSTPIPVGAKIHVRGVRS